MWCLSQHFQHCHWFCCCDWLCCCCWVLHWHTIQMTTTALPVATYDRFRSAMQVVQSCTAASLTSCAEIATTAAVSEAGCNLACTSMQQGSVSWQHLQHCHWLLLWLSILLWLRFCCCCRFQLHTVPNPQLAVYWYKFSSAMVMLPAMLHVSPAVLACKQQLCAAKGMKQQVMTCNSMQQGSVSWRQLRCHCFSAEAIFTGGMPAMQHQCGCYTIAKQCATKCDWPHATLAVCYDTITRDSRLV